MTTGQTTVGRRISLVAVYLELLLSQSNLAQIVRGSPVVASNSIDKRLERSVVRGVSETLGGWGSEGSARDDAGAAGTSALFSLGKLKRAREGARRLNHKGR